MVFQTVPSLAGMGHLRCQRVLSVPRLWRQNNFDAVVFSFVVSVFIYFSTLAVVLTLAAVKPLPNLLETKFYSPEMTNKLWSKSWPWSLNHIVRVGGTQQDHLLSKAKLLSCQNLQNDEGGHNCKKHKHAWVFHGVLGFASAPRATIKFCRADFTSPSADETKQRFPCG